jgi:SAM-dependent methyltransferase
MRLLFCLFAEDSGLLPTGLLAKVAETTKNKPRDFQAVVAPLFRSMASGGYFGADAIRFFDGGLFADDTVFELTNADLDVLGRAARLDWASVEPAVFGTLFERSLDPDKRSQLGAHYTSRADILLIVEPVLMAPLRREWAVVRAKAQDLIDKRDKLSGRARLPSQQALERLLIDFAGQIGRVRVLDPACGSGNFLYVALKELLDLEKEVITFGAQNGMSSFFPSVSPDQLFGIEINPYAHELTSVVVWIGYIQWLHDNGFGVPSEPILRPLHNIERHDAILTQAENGAPVEPTWPAADVIIGNPPFLGGNKVRQELGDAYVEALFSLYGGRVPAFADLVCYWFERAREQVAQGRTRRVGLLATQGIRGGVNRKVLEHIKASGDIFWAQSDRNWVLDGATVHVSMVGFDDGTETTHFLDGHAVSKINADLTASVDLTSARVLTENLHLSYQGPSPKGAFDIDNLTAQGMLSLRNINGRPNSDVVRPVVSAIDLVQRSRRKWTIDFGVLPIEEAVEYEAPFEYVKKHVYPTRSQNRRASYAEKWWQYAEARPGMREALKHRSRFIATPRVSKHRIFVWLTPDVLANDGTIVFARDDNYFWGVLQSKPHELWARGTGTQLREAESGFRYTPTSTFETFTFPWPPRQEPAGDTSIRAISEAARQLVEKREAWLNPSGSFESELKSGTLTSLYNEYPTWLELAHRALDRAVFAAYGWPPDLSNDEILARLLELNLKRSANQLADPTQYTETESSDEDLVV